MKTMKQKRNHFPKVHPRSSDGKEFFILSVDGDTALYTTKAKDDFRLVVRNDANILVEGITFRDGQAWIGAGSDHFTDLQEVLNGHGYTSTVTGTKAIGYTINILNIDGQIHVFELYADVAPLAELPCNEPEKMDEPEEAGNENYALPAGAKIITSAAPCQAFAIPADNPLSFEDEERIRKSAGEFAKIPHLIPSRFTANPEDDITMVYEFADAKQRDDYCGLYSVLMDALDQACNGKGKERHANDKPFEEQPMQTHCDALGSPQGMAYQVMKKTAEAMGMEEPERQIRELLGAINYAAGMIIWINRHNK